MSDWNPWGIRPRAVQVLDAYVIHGSSHVPGINQNTVVTTVERALKLMPDAPRLHKLMMWRDYRGLVPSPSEWPQPPVPIPFGLTERQAQAWDLYVSGMDEFEIGQELGIRTCNAITLLRRGGLCIPGDRDGVKQAAWKRARA